MATALSDEDVAAVRTELAGGAPVAVWFTPAAVGMPAGGSAKIVAVGEVMEGDFIEVRPAGSRDTVFFSPAELTRVRPPRKRAATRSAGAGAGAGKASSGATRPAAGAGAGGPAARSGPGSRARSTSAQLGAGAGVSSGGADPAMPEVGSATGQRSLNASAPAHEGESPEELASDGAGRAAVVPDVEAVDAGGRRTARKAGARVASPFTGAAEAGRELDDASTRATGKRAAAAARTTTASTRAAKRPGPARSAEVAVTLQSNAEGEWTVEVTTGAKRSVRPTSVQPGEVAAAARSLPPAVAAAIDASLESARVRQRERVDRLRAELEAAQKALDELAP